LQQSASPLRRRYPRIETPGGVSVFWRCGGRDDTSRVLNLSLGGLFIESRKPRVVGEKIELEFLVQEGQIKAAAEVRHVNTGRGAGLKFTAVKDGDHPHLTALFNRLSSPS
jgi:PilZ domain-containing protein